MAKLSVRLRNKKRQRLAGLQAPTREDLKKKAIDQSLSDEDRYEARRKLQALKRNGSKVRVVSRCVITGRGHAVYRKFGLSRIKFRELALLGQIPGVTKASW